MYEHCLWQAIQYPIRSYGILVATHSAPDTVGRIIFEDIKFRGYSKFHFKIFSWKKFRGYRVGDLLSDIF